MRTHLSRPRPRGLGAALVITLLVIAGATAPGMRHRTTTEQTAGRDSKIPAATSPVRNAVLAGPAVDATAEDSDAGFASTAEAGTTRLVAHQRGGDRVRLRRHRGSVRGDGKTVYVANRTLFRPGKARVPLPPRVRMRSWAVVDLDSGRLLGKHHARVELPQASTMKLLTAVTAMRTIPRDHRHRVTRFEKRQTCSCAGLERGAYYRRNTLLAGMLLPSGNDAAEALAGSHPQGRQAFYRAMNRTARAIGATDTVAKNASGLTAAGSHSSARDLVLLLDAALANERVADTLALRSARIATVRGHHAHTVWRSTDYVNRFRGSLGKSGWTTPAQNTLVVVTRIRGHRIATATMGAPTGYSTDGTRALTVWAAESFSDLEAVGRLPGF